MKAYILARLKEPSSWRGVVLLLTSLGITLSPEQAEAIIAIGMAVAGAVGVFAPDGRKQSIRGA